MMTPTLPDIPKVETAIVEMTNAFRRENALAEVRPNAELAKAARDYAAYLARTGTFSHTADGRQPAARADRAGYRYCQIAENLALNLDSRGFETRALAGLAIEGWKNSPGHRRNMLAPHVVEIGVGVARAADKDPKFISVQLFGRPKTLAYSFKIANVSKDAVAYSFDGKSHTIEPRYAVTHSACQPGEIAFQLPAGKKAEPTLASRYAARDGQVYTLKANPGGLLSLVVETAKEASAGVTKGKGKAQTK